MLDSSEKADLLPPARALSSRGLLLILHGRKALGPQTLGEFGLAIMRFNSHILIVTSVVTYYESWLKMLTGKLI